MRRFSPADLALLVSGCLHHHTHVAVDGAVLGRVVIYRNGVAFYERRATRRGRQARGPRAARPRRRLPEVADRRRSARRASRCRSSIPRKEADDGSYLTMTLETPDAPAGRRAADLRHRGAGVEAELPRRRRRQGQGDARGLGDRRQRRRARTGRACWSASARARRCRSATTCGACARIDRDLLAGEEKFAIAPPTGVSPYAEAGADARSSRARRRRGRAVTPRRPAGAV